MAKDLVTELKATGQLITDYILQYPAIAKIAPDYLRDGVTFYVRKGGKRLRPAILLWATEIVGGDVAAAIPAAAAIELSHTWTLVHDDIIDNDDLRRGGPSMHAYYRETWRERVVPPELDAWSRNLAMLVGDIQQAMATSMVNSLPVTVHPEVVRWLVNHLTTDWLPEVLNGEMLDVEYSIKPLEQIKEEDILTMLDRKTASTLAWCATAGALIGLNRVEPNHPTVKLLAEIFRQAGLAFQLQDDILGIIGDEAELGKPVGSDIRAGKRTVIAVHAYHQANPAQQALLQTILGKTNASATEIEQVKAVLEECGGIAYARKLAEDYTSRAELLLGELPESVPQQKLQALVNFITQRNY